MGVSSLHTLYAVDVDPITEANAVFIDGISDFAVAPGVQEVLLGGNGQVDPRYVAHMGSMPGISFTTTKLGTLLAEISNAFLISGTKIDSDPTHDGLEVFFQAMVEGGTRAGATSHIKLTINEGLLVPRGLNVAQNTIARLALELVITYDGTNDPIVLATSQSLIGTPDVSEAFTLGPISINGTPLVSTQSLNIDPGIQLTVQSGDGDKWPTFVGIMQRQPMITINTLDVSLLSTYGIMGTAISASDVILYLRKMAEGGTRVADATAEHVKITLDEGIIRVAPIAGAHGGLLGTQIIIRPTYDGANAILVIDPASAIT